MKRTIVFVLLLLATAFAISPTGLVVEVFSSYDTTLSIGPDGTAHVTKELAIKNVAQNVVVPGEIHIKLSKTAGGQQAAQVVSDLRAIGEDGLDLGAEIEDTGTETMLSYGIWTPLEPGNEYRFTIEYSTTDLVTGGLVFSTGAVPTTIASIPIQSSSITILLPAGTHASFAPGFEVSRNSDDLVLLYKAQAMESMFEYSSLPFNILLPVQGSIVFWGIIIFALVSILVASLKYRGFVHTTVTSIGKSPDAKLKKDIKALDTVYKDGMMSKTDYIKNKKRLTARLTAAKKRRKNN